MSILLRCKNLICCCACTNNVTDKLIKKRLTDHRYCGCKESNKQRKPTKMKTCDNDQTILVDEVFEALDYDFINEGALEECVLEDLVSLFISQF